MLVLEAGTSDCWECGWPGVLQLRDVHRGLWWGRGHG
jgi:hypothetical protein